MFQSRVKISIQRHVKSENQDDFMFANLCNLNISSPMTFHHKLRFPSPVLAALVALLKFGPHHVPGLLLLHGILNSEHEYSKELSDNSL